jgi:hypothetical protein
MLLGPEGLLSSSTWSVPSGREFGGVYESLRGPDAEPMVLEIYSQYYRERYRHIRAVA